MSGTTLTWTIPALRRDGNGHVQGHGQRGMRSTLRSVNAVTGDSAVGGARVPSSTCAARTAGSCGVAAPAADVGAPTAVLAAAVTAACTTTHRVGPPPTTTTTTTTTVPTVATTLRPLTPDAGNAFRCHRESVDEPRRSRSRPDRDRPRPHRGPSSTPGLTRSGSRSVSPRCGSTRSGRPATCASAPVGVRPTDI